MASVIKLREDWDPDKHSSGLNPNTVCVSRIRRDLSSLLKDPLSGILVIPDQDDITKMNVLVTGPCETPYEKGFFHFFMRMPYNYPIHPPRVKFLTTGAGSVRFNPNLYANGKVCLSILGTWSGPGWTPAQNVTSVVLSIQSLMCEKPYHNEPGYEFERNKDDVRNYNIVIYHETLRVGVCDVLEGKHPLPPNMIDVVSDSFIDFYDYYMAKIDELMVYQGKPFRDPHGFNRGTFNFIHIRERMGKIFKSIQKKNAKAKEVIVIDD
ncbi:Ubiquitin-conjugating enzyme E2 Z [Oopsacas minuta]|uniref:Ubiquitin-conjugating enzyme E2 Z n=1 Tax=Oopsacas minuta TaxID=111878 RepID=A0AAV7JB44_9METZ|nr:Ubiquitin-conjugating enzyme E2 Z [Oopsacas minuta]